VSKTGHAAITKTYGIHPLVAADVANTAARLALTVLPNTPKSTPLAVGHAVQQTDDKSLWVLRELPASNAANWNEWIYNPASKTYVDALVQGLDIKGSCRTVAVTNVALSGLQTINAVVLTAGEPGGRVLLTGQSNPAENGPWAAAVGAWSRASDCNTSAEVTSGLFVRITEGTHGGEGWVLTTADTVVLGTTPLTFQPFDGVGVTAQVATNTSNIATNTSNISANTTAIGLKADKLIAAATRADAPYTFVLADADLDLKLPFTVDRTATIPPGVFAVGAWLAGVSSGAGRVQFVEGAGVTLTSFATKYTRAPGSPWALYQRALNIWELYGDLYL
jgi:hypothetical protein